MTLPWACWINGDICPPETAAISPWASDVQHGLGAFETLRLTLDGPFAITRHLQRLERSAALLNLAPPPIVTIRDAAWQVHRQALPQLQQRHRDHPEQHTVARLRITWTKTVEDDDPALNQSSQQQPGTPVPNTHEPSPHRSAASEHSHAGPTPAQPKTTQTPRPHDRRDLDHPPTTGNLIIHAQPAPRRHRTASIATSTHLHNEKSAITGAKSLSYGHNMQLMRQAHINGVDELILSNTAGNLCEGAASNIFLVLNGELTTPPLSDGALPGITRELMLLWATAAGIPIVERSVPTEELAEAQGLAISSSLRQCQPVTSLDGKAVPIPEIIENVRDLFADQSRENIDP